MGINEKFVKENIEVLKSFDDSRFNPKPVYVSNEMKVIVAYFKAGQFIPVHTPGVDVVLCILEGTAEVVADNEKFKVREKDLIVVPRDIKRGIRALTELTVLHIVQPVPSEKDHQEVHTKIALGKFE